MKSFGYVMTQIERDLQSKYGNQPVKEKSIVHERFLRGPNGDITNDQPKAKFGWVQMANGLVKEASIASVGGKPFAKDPVTKQIDINDAANKLKVLAGGLFQKNNIKVDLDNYMIVGQAWNDIQVESDPKTGDLSAQKFLMLLLKNQQLLGVQQQPAEDEQNAPKQKSAGQPFLGQKGTVAKGAVQPTLSPIGR